MSGYVNSTRISTGFWLRSKSCSAKRRPPVYGDELLTDKEVSHLLKVSRRTLQDYRSNGILPYIQVGGKILYRASDIERTLMDGYREAYRSRK